MNIGSCSYGSGTRSWQNTGQHTIKCREIHVKSIISVLAVLLTASLLVSQTGCTKSAQDTAALNPALTTPVPEGMLRGTVVETMDSGGYTYVLVEAGQDQASPNQIWAAGPLTSVAVGDVVQFSQGMPMNQFRSNTLNRTFDLLLFVGTISNLTTPAPTQASVSMPATSDPAASKPAATIVADISVDALEPGQDIASVFDNAVSLAGQQVSLRGKVVKFNSNILGWNFIHIQDGSGDAAGSNNDLTVTSKDTTAVGETIVVTGTLILDKDFGAGYSFPVLLEGASITSE